MQQTHVFCDPGCHAKRIVRDHPVNAAPPHAGTDRQHQSPDLLPRACAGWPLQDCAERLGGVATVFLGDDVLPLGRRLRFDVFAHVLGADVVVCLT